MVKRQCAHGVELHSPLVGLVLAALIGAAVGCGTTTGPGPGPGPGPAPGPAVNHNLQINRFTTSALTNARADQILAGMGTCLQDVDSTGDIACDVGFTRNGPVTAFATGTGVINSLADFNAVIALPGEVKVVNQINWCGALVPNVIGCANVPGNSLAVIRFTPALEEILWAHEFGHNKGRNHRNGVNLVMHPSIAATRRAVNQDECIAFEQP